MIGCAIGRQCVSGNAHKCPESLEPLPSGSPPTPDNGTLRKRLAPVAGGRQVAALSQLDVSQLRHGAMHHLAIEPLDRRKLTLAPSTPFAISARHARLVARRLQPPRTRTVCAVRAACASRSTRRPLSAAALRSHRLRCSSSCATLDSSLVARAASRFALAPSALIALLVRHALFAARHLRLPRACTACAARAACTPRSTRRPLSAAALRSFCLRCSSSCATLGSSLVACAASRSAPAPPALIALLVRHARSVTRHLRLPCTRAVCAARAACAPRSTRRPPSAAAPPSRCLRRSRCSCATLGLSLAARSCPAPAPPALLALPVSYARLVTRRL